VITKIERNNNLIYEHFVICNQCLKEVKANQQGVKPRKDALVKYLWFPSEGECDALPMDCFSVQL